MNRDDLEAALDRHHSPSARAALAELQAGADFTISRSSASARQLWAIWSARHENLLDDGAAPWPGLAEAVDSLHAEGTGRIYLANVIGSQQRFIVFLSEDLTHCIACM
ncbi:hypothetical protein [Streptomyces sp. NPDC000983]|uniref:hypothetical protein n=1 Tax=Streptomyces sp. NPDC000983 TaxID=3154373 RepID=UPI00331E6FE4